MKRAAILFGMAIALAGSAWSAQLYRWVDEQGRVEWRDTPPPASVPASRVEQRRVGSRAPDVAGLPYAVQLAVKRFPVTLWVTNCGSACDQAKAHLARRGVPYTEKDALADVEAFQKATGTTEVPVLYVGSNVVKGYLESAYDEALDAAGYPRTAPPGSQTAARATPAASGNAPRPAANQPVRLFTHPTCGAPCEEAKSLLAARGVPYQEISAEDDAQIAELEKLSGGRNVPVLVIGQNVTRGFLDETYHRVLDAAGFRR